MKLEGDVGVLGNGAGLTMATVDVVTFVGGRPADFCDLGGGGDAQGVVDALEVITKDADVRSIFFNIFGGITRCDELAAQRMQPGAGPADLAGQHRQRDQAARVVGAVDVLRDAHAPQDHRRRATWRTARATSRIVCAGMPQIGAIASGLNAGDVVAQLVVAAGAVGDERLVDEPFLDDRVHHRVQQRDVGVGLELQVVRRVARELRAARIGEDQPACRSSPRS